MYDSYYSEPEDCRDFEPEDDLEYVYDDREINFDGGFDY